MADWPQQLAEFYRSERGPLYRCALAIVGCGQSAEDAVHDAFASMFTLKQQPRNLRAYAFRAVRNAAIDTIRSNGVNQSHLLGIAHLYTNRSEAAPHDQLVYPSSQSIAAALATLSAEQAEVIVLRHASGLRFREIAVVMGKPQGTVATWYRRGLEQLRDELMPPRGAD